MTDQFNSSTTGGHRKDFPHCVRRMFDDKRRKRKITIKVHRYYGMGTHYYVSCDIERNYWADEVNQCWRRFWDEEVEPIEHTIRDLSKRCQTIQEAGAHIRRIKSLKKFARYQFQDEATEELKWYYKEGD